MEKNKIRSNYTLSTRDSLQVYGHSELETERMEKDISKESRGSYSHIRQTRL